MTPELTARLEDERWSAFVRRLADHLAAQWPAMPERLGPRWAEFVDRAVQVALARGIDRAAAVARYVNLSIVWGPGFHDRPGFEWALGHLAAPRREADGGWAAMHRLQQRSLAELARRSDVRIEPAALAAADARLAEAFGRLGRRGALEPTEPPPLPRVACDLEAVELRLLESALVERVVHAAGAGSGAAAWTREPVPLPPPLRADATRPLPPRIAVLAGWPDGPNGGGGGGGGATRGGAAPTTRLQLRTRAHALCDADRHPVAAFAGTHGLWRWHGPETRAVSWPVSTLAQPRAAAGPGVAIAEETAPDIFRLDLETCGLRDEGEAIGPLSTQVWAWPAAQWWLHVARRPPEAAALTAEAAAPAPEHPAAAGATRCRVQCDGRDEDAGGVERGFAALDAATGRALQALLADWSGQPGVSSPALDGRLALLTGEGGLAWGWALPPGGLDGRAAMRVVAALAMQAVVAEWRLDGELALDGARSRVSIAVERSVPWSFELQRESDELPLLESMLKARCTFELPLAVEIVPLGSDSGALFEAVAPGAGALAGEVGLRPRTAGGSGYEWFAVLRLAPVSVPVCWRDPLLGERRLVLPLLPGRTLVEWRLG